jgi:hypothetical protein
MRGRGKVWRGRYFGLGLGGERSFGWFKGRVRVTQGRREKQRVLLLRFGGFAGLRRHSGYLRQEFARRRGDAKKNIGAVFFAVWRLCVTALFFLSKGFPSIFRSETRRHGVNSENGCCESVSPLYRKHRHQQCGPAHHVAADQTRVGGLQPGLFLLLLSGSRCRPIQGAAGPADDV